MMRNVVLYGDLAEKHGKFHRVDVSSVGEGMRAVECRSPGFMGDIKRDTHYEVVRGENLDCEHLDEATVQMEFDDGDFHIAPVIEGSKRGFFQTIIGAVLIIVGVIMLFTPLAAFAPFVIKLGAGVMLGGIAQMLTPMPEIQDYSQREQADERQSFIFDGPVNTMEQGGSIPIIYGQVTMGSTVISSAIDVEDI